jgi:hypothetical protein
MLEIGNRTTLTWSSGGQLTGSIGVLVQADGLRLMYAVTTHDGTKISVNERAAGSKGADGEPVSAGSGAVCRRRRRAPIAADAAICRRRRRAPIAADAANGSGPPRAWHPALALLPFRHLQQLQDHASLALQERQAGL